MSEWGNPLEQTSSTHAPIHNAWEGTRGTETSKYPEEEKETSIPSVAASESGRAQTVMRASRGSDCGRDLQRTGERHWNSRPERVRAPYPKSEAARQDPEYHETRETLWEGAETTP